MSGQRIGYIQVSTQEQNPDRQLEGEPGILVWRLYLSTSTHRSLVTTFCRYSALIPYPDEPIRLGKAVVDFLPSPSELIR